MFKKNCYACITACVFILAGCAPKGNKSVLMPGNPEEYVKNGNKFFEDGKIDKALEDFMRAVRIDPKYGQAYTGIGLVYLIKKDYDKALKNLKLGETYNAGIEVNIAYIRFYTEKRDKDWSKYAESEYRNGLKISLDDERLYYFMGLAYERDYEFDKASIAFKKVLGLNKRYVKEANEEWELIQNVQRASPGTNIGIQIALMKKIGRAEAAAIFIEELNLGKLYGKKEKGHDFFNAAPEKALKTMQARDIKGHSLEAYMDMVIRIGIRGLEVFPDNTFQPQKLVTRAEYAVMIEDILVKITGDKTISTEYSGKGSLFPDVRESYYAFNAIMVAAGRGILPAKLNGEFGTEDNISGVDALLAIRKLKEELKL